MSDNAIANLWESARRTLLPGHRSPAEEAAQRRAFVAGIDAALGEVVRFMQAHGEDAAPRLVQVLTSDLADYLREVEA